MQLAQYLNEPINDLSVLGLVLDTPLEKLINAANHAADFYVPNRPKIKANGKIRQTYRVLPTLKTIQDKIKNNIFFNVSIPIYLMGGIKSHQNDRGFVQGANVHTGCYVVIHEDICDFFPSIQAAKVYNMWLNFFQFPSEVADLLTKLTTYKGCVPQGAKTSSYIANLIFWEWEPELEDFCSKRGLIYTRYIDDIHVSASRRLAKKELTEIIGKLHKFMYGQGFKLHKHTIQIRNDKVLIHNLNINSGKPTIPKVKRQQIRAAVRQFELDEPNNISESDFQEKVSILQGRIANLATLHPKKAEEYKQRISAVIASKKFGA